MPDRISENDILIPALYIIDKYGTATTASIRAELVKMFNPQGEDAAILKGRSDSKFTQIIRNLTGSHFATNEFGKYVNKNNIYFSLNADGVSFLREHIADCEYIYNNEFKYDENISVARKIHTAATKSKKLITYSEDNTVIEGRAIETISKTKKRSAILREYAVEHYRDKNGHVKCHICGFDFLETYGEIGRLYIQIHHEHPICDYDDGGVSKTLEEAVKNVKPVCANCHCMLHRKKSALSVDELKNIICTKK